VFSYRLIKFVVKDTKISALLGTGCCPHLIIKERERCCLQEENVAVRRIQLGKEDIKDFIKGI